MKNLMGKFRKLIYNNAFTTSIIVGIIILLVALYFGGEQETFKPQTLVLLATFTTIFWYSLETKLLKNATNIANSLQAEPLLVLQYRKKENKDQLYIVNYGKGPAFNLEMKIENIHGFFNFSLPNPNPLGHMEEQVLILANQGVNNHNLEAKITLYFDRFEQVAEEEKRKRIFKIFSVSDGYRIEYIG